MSLEKKLRAISPRLFTQDGTASGVIKVSDSTLFKVEQEVTLQSNTQPSLQLAIKDIPNATTLIVGPRGKPLSVTYDISAFLTADMSSVETSLQVRPTVIEQDISRAVYEEAPTVALRTFLVDILGRGISDDNPLPVAAQLADGRATSVVKFRVDYPIADTEMFVILPSSTKRIYMAPENVDAKMRVSFTLNGTTDVGDDYTTVHVGNSYDRNDIKLTGKILYFQANKPGLVIEVEAWV